MRKSFYVNWIDTGLFAKVIVEDNSTGTPVLVDEFEMVETYDGIYLASFEPEAGIPYLYTARVYTDDTFTTVDPNYSASVGDFQSTETVLNILQEAVMAGQVSEALIDGEIVFSQGDTPTLSLTATTDDGTPFDLTGAVLLWSFYHVSPLRRLHKYSANYNQ